MADDTTLNILYGSRTGNARAAADLARDYARHLGLAAELHDTRSVEIDEFLTWKNVLIAVSTHGEGDPPAAVEMFYHDLHDTNGHSMKGTRFGVLALGDSSYSDFCKTGNDIRTRLLELGADETVPLVECDIDFEENARQWVRRSVETFRELLPREREAGDKPFAFELKTGDSDFENAFFAPVLEKRLLTEPDAEKRTIHLSLDLEGFPDSYLPGDSFGIYLHNPRFLVDRLLRSARYDPSHPVETRNGLKMLKEALLAEYELTVLTPVVVRAYAELTGDPRLVEIIAAEDRLDDYCRNRDVVDLVESFPPPEDPEDLLSTLRKLAPRLFSAASIYDPVDPRVDLTISLVEYPVDDRLHRGVCSTYIADRVEEGDTVPVFLDPNESFRLPRDDNAPVVMVATGTGIAPFRAFLQERERRGASGDNWLFFGDRREASDYLYRRDLERHLESGLLTRVDTAFSRDSEEKVYVQHRLEAAGREVYRWLSERGAYIYLCGNKRSMGKDVKDTLENILARQGGLSRERAAEFLQELRSQKRYQMDLY